MLRVIEDDISAETGRKEGGYGIFKVRKEKTDMREHK